MLEPVIERFETNPGICHRYTGPFRSKIILRLDSNQPAHRICWLYEGCLGYALIAQAGVGNVLIFHA